MTSTTQGARPELLTGGGNGEERKEDKRKGGEKEGKERRKGRKDKGRGKKRRKKAYIITVLHYFLPS